MEQEIPNKEISETKTATSYKTRSCASSKDSLLRMIAKARAKASSAKAKIPFVEREKHLKTTNAEIQASLELLQQQKEAAAAEAELLALLTECDMEQKSVHTNLPGVPEENTQVRTSRYVLQHGQTSEACTCGNSSTEQNQAVPPTDQSQHTLNAAANCVHPEPSYPISAAHNALPDTPRNSESPHITDFTRFLLKRELLTSRFITFNDQPESYAAWKAGFRQIIIELQATPNEELDLLQRWLGPSSAKQATTIRASNMGDPQRGLERIWRRLDDRYGCPEMVESALKSKLNHFPRMSIKDVKKLYELVDIITEIESVMEDDTYKSLLSYFNTSSGVIPIVNKLPFAWQEKWTNEAVKYKKSHQTSFPPFRVFAGFIRDLCNVKNDPSFAYENYTPSAYNKERTPNSSLMKGRISTRKTDIAQTPPNMDNSKYCPFHKSSHHSLNRCRGFRYLPLSERRDLLRHYKFCFRCCSSEQHASPDCKETIKCGVCGDNTHPSAMHLDSVKQPIRTHGGEQHFADAPRTTPTHGGEQSQPPVVKSTCTSICGNVSFSRSCSKTVLVKVYHQDHPENQLLAYAIIDDQSNSSLAKPELFDKLSLPSSHISYTLSTCSGELEHHGKQSMGVMVESYDGQTTVKIPNIIECGNIPNNREEIPTPEILSQHPHLQSIQHLIPNLHLQADILLLLGRDIPVVHHVLDQKTGPPNGPYAQKLSLGWVVVGNVCLGKAHIPDRLDVKKTYISLDGRQSLFPPCENHMVIKSCSPVMKTDHDDIGKDVFRTSIDDEKTGLSVEDRQFLSIMDREFSKDSLTGNWSAPLPFKLTRPRLPNNYEVALQRAKSLHSSLQKHPEKAVHFKSFMDKILANQHAEPAPRVGDGEECWYLPIFGVYHPKKKDSLRAVFDSSSKYQNLSLNDVLMKGPDLINQLIGVLIRFRKEPIAMTADIEQMFYGFKVQKQHRNFLRFLWYSDNDYSKPLTEWRMTVHVFGNSPSPAVATYGLRQTVTHPSANCDEDVKRFVCRDFYVDDGLTSVQTPEEAVSLMKRTQEALKLNGNLRLHKITSNSIEVMEAFPNEDLAKDVKELDLRFDEAPIQRSLGLYWDLKQDAFTFNICSDEKPFTRRGILSTVNSIYDPLGFIAPVVIQGRHLLRTMMSQTVDWDEPLSEDYLTDWELWKKSLHDLHDLQIPRTYTDSIKTSTKTELHIYSDASQKAIAAVAYLKTYGSDGNIQLGFVFGKAKLAPVKGHTIPRLELCAAVLAVEIYSLVREQLDTEIHATQFYIDSKVVLGYVHNEQRRFHIYVSNRVERIRRLTTPNQWKFIRTDLNPADEGTRFLPADHMKNSSWLTGPNQLSCQAYTPDEDFYPLQDPENDKEIRKEIKTLATHITYSLGTHRFERFSSWHRLTRVIALLYHVIQSTKQPTGDCQGWHLCNRRKDPRLTHIAEKIIIKAVQREVYTVEIRNLDAGNPLPKDSSLLPLNPLLDTDGVLRIGGRLRKSQLPIEEINPMILPSSHHVSKLLVRHYHEQIHHQGRHLTEGAIRSAGLWIVGCKRLVSSIIHFCVQCKKLRSKPPYQLMADLPVARLTPAPPFTYVGIDVFGPWLVVTRRTKGHVAKDKRWAVLFTCLSSRAVHLEAIEDMSASTFINALRRFLSLRGKVLEFYSDRGTNFVGAARELGVNYIFDEDGPVMDFLNKEGSRWIFNPPHASHMGGAWERMIGVARRILDALLKDISSKHLTHDVLVTLLAEITAIINGRPLVPVSTDPENPFVLSPATLLTQKTNYHTNFDLTFNVKDLYKRQWRCVQHLADTFWHRWKTEYLSTLQQRSKWTLDQPNLHKGDVVLMKDNDAQRNQWPMGVITEVLPSDDGKIRKVVIRVLRDGIPTTYTRPIKETVLLLSKTN